MNRDAETAADRTAVPEQPQAHGTEEPYSEIPEIPPMIAKSQEAFRRDLPELLETHYGKWVAYHGDERLGFGKTQTELYQKGFRLGLTERDLVARCIIPELEDDDIEWNPYREFDDPEFDEGDSPCP